MGDGMEISGLLLLAWLSSDWLLTWSCPGLLSLGQRIISEVLRDLRAKWDALLSSLLGKRWGLAGCVSETEMKAQKAPLASLPLRASQGHQLGPNWCIQILMGPHLPEAQNPPWSSGKKKMKQYNYPELPGLNTPTEEENLKDKARTKVPAQGQRTSSARSQSITNQNMKPIYFDVC